MADILFLGGGFLGALAILIWSSDVEAERRGEYHAADMDPRIANASPEKIRSIYREIFAPVRHSPLDSWMHVEAETDEAAADLLAAKLGGKS